ncbi:MAG TPA: IPT/TIG domain-containing protein, partial [Thermoguttaceae bacterium]|nr:IPT/TIG domain-containing protein [Thermoguttaceae bacterium]
SYEDPNEPIRIVDELRGRVHNIQARRLNGPAAPRIARFSSNTPALANGIAIGIHGADFDDGAQVLVNGQRLSRVEYVDNTQLRATLDHLAAGSPNVLTVVNSSGLTADMPTELPFGHIVRHVEPREVSPIGGDQITLVGGGFDHSTRVFIGGKPAQTVEVLDSTRMKVRVPPARPGPATIEVTGDGTTFVGSPAFAYSPHPYLWYQGEELAELREKFNDPAFADYRRLIVEKATGPEEELGRIGTPSNAAIIHGYLWAYLLSGEQSYREKLFAAVDALLTGTDRLPTNEFGHPGRRMQALSLDEFMCHNGEAVATVYDTLFEELSPEKRTAMLKYLDAHLAYFLDRLRANDWWYRNNPSNTIAVGNGCGGTIALALMHGRPTAREAIDLAVDNIRTRYVAMAEDGGCIEGNLYWDYGLTYQLLFGHALKNTTGDDRGLLTDAKFDKIPSFVETQLGGDGCFLTFNDTQPWLTGMAVCADFGSRLDSPLLRWIADRTAREAVSGDTTVFTRPQFYALAFRVRDHKPAPEQFPGVATLAYLPVLNWGVMRSAGTSFEPKLVVGIKGRDGQTTHHAQEDLGGFVLQADGESLLIDPGYYQGKADNHSLPLIGAKGPNSRGTALITDAWENAGLRTMTVDATEAYGDAGATRVRRVFAVVGDEAVIVLDDIVVAEEKPSRVTCQLQCGFPAEVLADKRSATITGKKANLAIRTFGAAVELDSAGPLDFERSWVFAETGVAWYEVSGEYTAEQNTPLVAVLLPYVADDEPPTAIARYAGNRIDVSLASGKTVAFVKTDAGWKLAQSQQ